MENSKEPTSQTTTTIVHYPTNSLVLEEAMAQELRRRKAGQEGGGDLVGDVVMSSGLVASSLLASSPTHHGNALKLHVPLFYTICPEFLQSLIRSVWCFSSLRPQWKKRYLILVGSYLYKFLSPSSSSSVKGSPIPVDAFDVHIVEDCDREDGDLWGVTLPCGYEGMFCVSSIRKQQYYAVPTRQDATVWVTSLRERRHETIRRSMGHTAHMPYPPAWNHLDGLAASLVQSKERIRQRQQHLSSTNRDMDMAAGPLPRGYYG